jgi:hypothetical protein
MKNLVPFSQRTYGVIGGERERRSRAPVPIFVSHTCSWVNHEDRGRGQDHTFGRQVRPPGGLRTRRPYG